MIYRVWARVRRTHCDEWEARNPRSYWWGCAGQPVDRCMWRHAALDEAVKAEDLDLAAVTFLADAAKCYEHVGHPLLVAEARATGFPLLVLKLAIAGYRTQRRLQ
eukprot:6299626-Karenia_brevis.AAC.1